MIFSSVAGETLWVESYVYVHVCTCAHIMGPAVDIGNSVEEETVAWEANDT